MSKPLAMATIIDRVDALVAELEAEGYALADIADSLDEYLELADEFGYLR